MLRRETANHPDRLRAGLAGLRRYQQAPRDPAPIRPAVARVGRAVLRDGGGAGPVVVVVPSIINSPAILDLGHGRSLVAHLAERGLRPLLLDWGSPTPDGATLSLAGHVETLLMPLLEDLGEPAALLGYCLGGTMVTAAAALVPVRGLALVASPWRFGSYPPATRAALRAFWAQAEPAAHALGLLPMEALQAAFWRLDPARTIRKYERLAGDGVDADQLKAFARLEDWANDGPPLPFGAARDLFEDLFERDLPGRGEWRVAGRSIDPRRITVPMLDIASTTDRIVPAAAALGMGRRMTLDLGHVGMVIGGRAMARLWTPLTAWLEDLAGR